MGTGSGSRPGKLTAGVRVAVYFPRWSISCRTCESVMIREDGTVQRNAVGEIQDRGPLQPTPCHKCPKVPKHERDANPGDWKYLRSKADELTDQNRRAWEFYKRLKGVNFQHPAAVDPLVTWYAGALRETEDTYARHESTRTYELLDLTFAVMVKTIKGR